jgi:hypothetical protein
MRENDGKAKKVMKALKEAGQQLVKHGSIQKDLLSGISQPLVSEQELRAQWNASYEDVKGKCGFRQSGWLSRFWH